MASGRPFTESPSQQSEPKEMKSKSAKQLRVNDNCGVEYKMPSYGIRSWVKQALQDL